MSHPYTSSLQKKINHSVVFGELFGLIFIPQIYSHKLARTHLQFTNSIYSMYILYSIIYIHIHEDSKSPHTYTSFWILLAFWVSIRDLRILPKDPWREVPWGELPDLAAPTTERLQRLHHAMEVRSEAGRLGRWLGRWWFVRVVIC